MKLRQSRRSSAKIKMALQGSAGSGKTYSALLLAKGLLGGSMDKVALIDTENGSGDLYADLGNYNVLGLDAPFSPESYIEAIDVCLKAGMQVIIIDSMSHCWDFLLDVHSKMPGNSFTNWSKITPRQNSFIQKILSSPAHIIATMRVKQDYVLNQKNGKMVPEKVGLKAVQRNDVDYEFTIVFDLDIAHGARASKDRTGLFADKPEFVINSATGKKIKQWCQNGNPDELSSLIDQIKKIDKVEGLRIFYKSHPQHQEKILPHLNERKLQLTQEQEILPNQSIINSQNQANGIDADKQS